MYVGLGIIENQLGRHAQAREHCQQAEKTLVELVEKQPENIDFRRRLAWVRESLANLPLDDRKLEDVAQVAREALKLREQIADQQGHDESRRELAASLVTLASILSKLGEFGPAVEAYDRAVALLRELAEHDAESEAYRGQLASALYNRGLLAWVEDRLSSAWDDTLEAEELREKLAATRPGVLEYQLDLGTAHASLGRIAESRGDKEAALDWLTLAIDALSPLRAKLAGQPAAQASLRLAYTQRATLLTGLSRPGEAIEDLNHAIELAAPPERGRLRHSRGQLQFVLGRYDDALRGARELKEDYKRDGARLVSLASSCAAGPIFFGKLEGLSQEDRNRLSEGYATVAVELLEKARFEGYFRDAQRAEKLLRGDEVWQPLRDREDFRRLGAAIEAEKD
jgi:tetratricopeptide (TPR) repeat protein